jgi:hypothetical protein
MRVSKIWYGLLLVLILAGMGGLVASCQPAAETEGVAQAQEACPAPIQETETMSPSENENVVSTEEKSIPPIDLAEPEYTETATFSLG